MAGKSDLETAYTEVVCYIESIGYDDPTTIANMMDTPFRAMNALCELILPLKHIKSEVRAELDRKFPIGPSKPGETRPKEAVRGITTTGICPHHLLPVVYDVAIWLDVGPHDHVLGLSKYARIADLLCKRPVLQEQFARDLAAVFTTGWEGIGLGARGCLTRVVGKHMCCICRGAAQDRFELVSLIPVGSLEHPREYEAFLEYIKWGM
jgi:GTP cyclohydrolase I